jgi:hypothetical protein
MSILPFNRVENRLLPALTIIAFLFALIGGAFASIPIIGGLFGILLIGLATAAFKKPLLGLSLFIPLVAAGLTQLYIPSLAFIRWIAPLTASLLYLHIIFEAIKDSNYKFELSWPLKWALIFLSITLVSTLINWQGAINSTLGLKLYFQMWGLLFGISLLHWHPKTLDNALKFILLLGFIQLPFVLQQYFYIVPTRAALWIYGVVPLDVVSGTLGADRNGGGRNMVLSLLLVISFITIIAMWRRQAISFKFLMIATPILLTPLFLNESKFAFILLTVSLAYVFRGDLVHKPLRFLGIAIFGTVLSVGLLFSYSASFGKGKSIADTVEFIFKSNEGSTGYGGQLLNRKTVYTFWAKQHGINDIPGTLIGHGLGSSHESAEGALKTARNLATTKYPHYGIGLTGLSSLLWDTGLLGTSAAFAMLASAFLAARRLAFFHRNNAARMGLFEGLQAVILSIALMQLHSNYFVLDPNSQTLAYLLLGYISYWSINKNKSIIELNGKNV